MIEKGEEKNFKDKKLLVISPHCLTFVKDQITCLARHFKEIIVVVPLTYVPTILQKSFKRFKKRSWLIDSTNIPKNVKIYSPKHLALPLIGRLNQYFVFRSIDKMIQKENLGFDLIHTHFTWPFGHIGVELKEKYKKPLIITAHGYDIYDLPFRNSYWQSKIKKILDSADYIITVSNKNLDCIKKLKVGTHVKVISNGFDEKLFYPRDKEECRKKLNLPINKKIILTVGNLVEVKGQKYLIKAMKKIVEKRKDVLLVIVGSGILKQELGNLIEYFNLQNYINLVGGKPHNEIPLWMNACDIFVLSRLNEGCPTAASEALGCGKPFIGTKVGGVPEICINDKMGYLVEPANSDELAEKILAALDKEWVSEDILNHAKPFTWERITEKIMQVYEDLLEDKKNTEGVEK